MANIGSTTGLISVRDALIEAVVVLHKSGFDRPRRFVPEHLGPEAHVGFDRSAIVAIEQALVRGANAYPQDFDGTEGAERAAARMEVVLLAALADAQREPSRFRLENPEPRLTFEDADLRLRRLATERFSRTQSFSVVIKGVHIKYVIRRLCPGFWPFC